MFLNNIVCNRRSCFGKFSIKRKFISKLNDGCCFKFYRWGFYYIVIDYLNELGITNILGERR